MLDTTAFSFTDTTMDTLLTQTPTPLGQQPTGRDRSMVVMESNRFYLVDLRTNATLMWGNA